MGPRGTDTRHGSDALRLFVALMFPPDAEAFLRRQCRAWSELGSRHGARFARTFHITLKFLGDVSRANALAVSKALSASYESVGAFRVTAGRLGAFPSAARASVLWWGVDEGREALRVCAARTETCLRPLGFRRERRAFVPHVTLARFRHGADLKEWLRAEEARRTTDDPSSFPSFTARELTLVQSELRREGPVYTPLASYPLGGAKRDRPA